MNPRHWYFALVFAAAGAPAPAADTAKPALTFAWPAMTCAIRQKLEQANDKPIESRYTLTTRAVDGGLRVSFLGFEVIDTFPEMPARARRNFLDTENLLGKSSAERVFDVDAAGRFVHAESPADVEARMKSSGKPLPLLLGGSQSRLDAKYRLGWNDFIGNWIGRESSAGELRPLKIEHPGDEFWLTYDVPTEVTIGAPADCARGGHPVHCVTIRTRFVPGYRDAAKTDETDMRHEDSSEIVLEPDTMIPHSWMEEMKYRGGSLNGALKSRYSRTFECVVGS